MRATNLVPALILVLAFGCGDDHSTNDGGIDSGTAGSDFAAPASGIDLAIAGDGGESCPAAAPQGACTTADLTCNYGPTKCVCVAPEMMWACCNPTPMDCPMQPPANASPCCSIQIPATICGIDCGSMLATSCTCSSFHWACTPGC
jgi:hypothetical protein